jgi:HSP20 family protein
VVSSKHEEKKEEKDNDGKYTRREFSYSSFSRTFNLPEDVDEENISAKYNDGVLNVQIPKKAIEAKKAKQILIG